MVNFNFVDIPEFNFNKNIFSQWITSSIKEEGKIPGNIVYHFCSDEKILAINNGYKLITIKHDEPITKSYIKARINNNVE